MARVIMALLMGLFSLFLFFVVAEAASYFLGNAGLILALILMAAYFFIVQYRASRDNPDAYRKDWPVMLSFDATWIIVGFLMILRERNQAAIFQGLEIIFSCLAVTWAGAFAASMKARRPSL